MAKIQKIRQPCDDSMHPWSMLCEGVSLCDIEQVRLSLLLLFLLGVFALIEKEQEEQSKETDDFTATTVHYKMSTMEKADGLSQESKTTLHWPG